MLLAGGLSSSASAGIGDRTGAIEHDRRGPANGTPKRPGPTAPVAASLPAAPPDTVATVKPAASAPPAYRGTSVSLRNVVSALSFNRAAEPTYNPYYGMQISIAPRYWFNQQFYVRGSFDVASELTQADWTNDRFFIGDTGVAFGGDGLFTIPGVGASVSGELSFGIPTSKASQASTRLLGTAASVSISRPLGSFSLSYSGNVDKSWNQYTTGSPTHALLQPCNVAEGTGCVAMHVNTGRRNVDWSVSNAISAGFKATPWLSFGANVGLSHAFLYPLDDVPEVSLRPPDTADTRYFMSTGLSASLRATEELTVGMGLRSSYGQLAPDGSYRVPLFNRFTMLSVDLSLNVAGLVSKLRS